MTSDDLGRAIVIRRGTNQLSLYQVAKKSKLIRDLQGRDRALAVPDAAREVRGRQQAAQSLVVSADDIRLGEGPGPIPPGPGNPLGTRWMGLSAPYVGIHGTPDAASIGYSASHGCIRMLIPQVEWLFTQVDVGTPVFIVAA